MDISKRKIIGAPEIKLLEVSKVDETKIKGANMFPGLGGLYANIFICAKKRSGKTNLLGNILINCASKRTKIIFFVSTFHKDNAYISLAEKLDKMKIEYIAYTSLTEDGVNQLKALSEHLIQVNEQPEVAIKKTKLSAPVVMQFNNCKLTADGNIHPVIVEDVKIKKEKLLAPEYIFVLDDLSQELNDKSISYLMKRNRHIKCKTIISTQYIHDLPPDCRQQIDYCLLFGEMPEEKLKIIYKGLDIALDYPLFKLLYDDATTHRYHFLNINVRDDIYKEDFDKAYELKDEWKTPLAEKADDTDTEFDPDRNSKVKKIK